MCHLCFVCSVIKILVLLQYNTRALSCIVHSWETQMLYIQPLHNLVNVNDLSRQLRKSNASCLCKTAHAHIQVSRRFEFLAFTHTYSLVALATFVFTFLSSCILYIGWYCIFVLCNTNMCCVMLIHLALPCVFVYCQTIWVFLELDGFFFLYLHSELNSLH